MTKSPEVQDHPKSHILAVIVLSLLDIILIHPKGWATWVTVMRTLHWPRSPHHATAVQISCLLVILSQEQWEYLGWAHQKEMFLISLLQKLLLFKMLKKNLLVNSQIKKKKIFRKPMKNSAPILDWRIKSVEILAPNWLAKVGIRVILTKECGCYISVTLSMISWGRAEWILPLCILFIT